MHPALKKFDLWVFSQWWLYAPLLIPFSLYLVFFFLKWTILTTPIWVSGVIITQSFKK